GATRAQLRSMIRWEAVIIAVLGAVLGLAVGVFFGWTIVRALASQGITEFTLPAGQLLIFVVAAGLAGILAAVLPGRRAARIDGRRAITTEERRGMRSEYDSEGPARGFSSSTNYESRKGIELAANPRAALVFWWGELERQVRIEGTVAATSREESEAYFHSRPPGSQLSAAASPQSRVIEGRAILERRVSELATGSTGGGGGGPAVLG